MASANWFRCLYLAHASRPKSVREVYRLAKRLQGSRIVEVGISDLSRTVSLIEVAQRYAQQQTVNFTGLDWFDARPQDIAPLSLKDAYRVLRATGANVRLVPGAAAKAIASVANAHQNSDLLLIGPHVSDDELRGAWFYVPRMLHARSAVLREQSAAGEPSFARLSPEQIAAWAASAPGRRAA